MTLEEIRAATRNILHDYASEATAKLDASNYLLDYFINAAAEIVVLDLCELVPDPFIKTELISLDTTKTEYVITQEFLRIWGIRRNVAGNNPTIIPYVDYTEEDYLATVGMTKDEPDAWTLKGNSIIFFPKAAANKTNYALAILIVPEAASIPTTGPAYIPRIAQRLIPNMAAILVGRTFNPKISSGWTDMYAYTLKKVLDVLGSRIQQQPNLMKGSFVNRTYYDSRDKTTYDRIGFFER